MGHNLTQSWHDGSASGGGSCNSHCRPCCVDTVIHPHVFDDLSIFRIDCSGCRSASGSHAPALGENKVLEQTLVRNGYRPADCETTRRNRPSRCRKTVRKFDVVQRARVWGRRNGFSLRCASNGSQARQLCGR